MRSYFTYLLNEHLLLVFFSDSPPPTYDSLFGKIKHAKQASTGNVDFLQTALGITTNTSKHIPYHILEATRKLNSFKSTIVVLLFLLYIFLRKVWRYQSGNQIPIIRRTDNTIGQKDKTKSQTTIYKTLKIDQHEPHLKSGGELRCSGMIGSSCFINYTRRVTLVTNHEWRKDVNVMTTNRT